MRRIIRNGFAVAALAGALAFTGPAQADLFGGDVAELAAILAETIAQGITLGSQLTQLVRQVQMMQTMLSRLDPASYNAILALINDTELSYSQLVAQVNSIGYTLQGVNAEFLTTFPTDFSKTPIADFDSLYGQWQNQIWSSTLVAARAQSVLSTLRHNADNAAAILASSAANQGEIGQLQGVVQMLGVIESQNNSLITSLATTGRVIATNASTSASERQLAREKKKRNVQNYTKRGAPVTVPNKLP